MKGLIVISAYYPDNEGGSISGCRSFAKAVSLKHYVEIITLDTTNQGSRVSKVDGIKVTYLKVSQGLEWLSKSGWGFSVSFTRWFINNHKEYDFIYLKDLWNFSSLFAAVICILSRKKYILSSAGKFSKYALKRAFLKKLIISPLAFLILKKARFIHYPSLYEYQLTPKIISSLTKPMILQTAIQVLDKKNFNYAKQNNEPSKKVLYTVSRFDKIKRLDVLASNINNIKNCDVIHIGRYQDDLDYFNSLKEIYKKNTFKILYDLKNLDKDFDEKRVFFLGYQDIRAVDALINEYEKSIFIQMSFSEGQSNSILEAMARGSVCLVSEGCNMQDARKSNAIFVTDEINFETDLQYLLTNNQKFEEIKEKQISFLENFHSFQNIANSFDKQIKSIF